MNRGAGVTPLTVEQQELLSEWRALALQRMPYFAPILFEMRPLNAPSLGTFAVDRHWRLYIDFDEVASRGSLWCGEALLHEVGHLWYEHSRRAADAGLCTPDGELKSSFHGRISNLAGDAAINDDLIEAGCTTLGDGILPEHFGLPRHETYEFYVAELLKQAPQPSEEGGDGDGSGLTASSGCGSGAGNLPQGIELPSSDSLAGASKPATDADKDRAMQAAAAAMVDAASRSRGTVPGDLVAAAEGLLAPPQVPWQKVLKPALRSAANSRPGDDEPTYRRRNRRRSNAPFGAGRIIYPGRYSPTPRVALVRDTSGSVSNEEFDAITSEVVGIADKVGLRGNDLIILDVDAGVQHVARYTNSNDARIRHGFGGTDMRVGVEAAAELKPRVNAIVILTDGETPWPDTRPKGVQVIACIVTDRGHDRSSFNLPSWIRTVWIDPAGSTTRDRP